MPVNPRKIRENKCSKKVLYIMKKKNKFLCKKRSLDMILERKEGESETQYIWRIGQMIDAGQIDNWKSITPTLNKELRNDETEYRDESAYRKKYQYAKMFYDEIFSKRDDDEYIKELEEQKREIQKERIKLQDERANRNKNIRVEARVEQKLDYLEDVISKQGKIDYNPLKP